MWAILDVVLGRSLAALGSPVSLCPLRAAGALPQRLPQARVIQEDVLHPLADGRGVQRLLAHRPVRVEGVHDGIHQLGVQGGGVGELLPGVVRRLLLQRLGFQQLPLDDVVHVDELVVLGKFAFEETVNLLDNLLQEPLLALADDPATGADEGLQRLRIAGAERHRVLA